MERTVIEIAAADGICPASLFHPSTGEGLWPGLIVFMDGIGIRPVLFDACQRIADGGFVVLLPDLFYRAGPYTPVDYAALHNDPKIYQYWAETYVATTGNSRVASDAAYFLDALSADPAVRPGRVGTTGYCMGAGMSVTVAATYPERVGACAGFHGGFLATDASDSPHQLVPRIEGPVFLVIADRDEYMPTAQVERLRESFSEAQIPNRIETWKNALHGFTMADCPWYNPPASERHFLETREFFANALRA